MNFTKNANTSVGNRVALIAGVLFACAAVTVVIAVNRQLKGDALADARVQARLILDQNRAIRAYFNDQSRRKPFEMLAPLAKSGYSGPEWISVYAIREINKHSRASSDARYYYKESAINARSPENEADDYERGFIKKLNAAPTLIESAAVRTIGGEPVFTLLRRGETMEASCTSCHGTPQAAPAGLLRHYGGERSFGRSAGEVVSARSVRIPLASAYGRANRTSLQLSLFLVSLLGFLYASQHWLNRRLLYSPLRAIGARASQISSGEEQLGEEIPLPSGRELRELTAALNAMSVGSRATIDQLKQQSAEVARLNGELQGSEEELRELVDSMPVAMGVESGVGNRVGFLNKNFTKLFGYTNQDIPDIPHWWPLAYPDAAYREEIKARWSEMLNMAKTEPNETEPVEAMEATVTCRDGSRRMIEFRFSSIGDRNVITFIDLTERKQAEEMLRVREQEYRALVENVPDVIIRYDRECRRVYVNPAHERETGMPLSQALHAPLDWQWRATMPIYAYKARLRRVMETGIPCEIIVDWLARDGNPLVLALRVVPERNREGEVVGALAICRDITALKESERKLEEAQRIAHVGHSERDLETDHITYSDETYRILGLQDRPSTFSVAQLLELIHPVDRAKVAEAVDLAVHGGPPIEVEYRVVHLDGEVRFIYSYGEVIRDDTGRPRWVFGVLQDITELRLAEQALRESETLYRSLVTAMAEGICLQLSDGEITAVNLAAARIEGRSPEQILGRTPDDPQRGAISEDGTPFPVELHPSMVTLRTGEPQTDVVMGIHRPDGTLAWVSFNSQPMIVAGEYAVVTTFHDITERKLAEQELHKLNQELEQLAKKRTAELEEMYKELERTNRLFVGRELRMIELKERIKELEK